VLTQMYNWERRTVPISKRVDKLIVGRGRPRSGARMGRALGKRSRGPFKGEKISKGNEGRDPRKLSAKLACGKKGEVVGHRGLRGENGAEPGILWPT